MTLPRRSIFSFLAAALPAVKAEPVKAHAAGQGVVWIPDPEIENCGASCIAVDITIGDIFEHAAINDEPAS